MEQPSGEVAPEELYYGQGADEQGGSSVTTC